MKQKESQAIGPSDVKKALFRRLTNEPNFAEGESIRAILCPVMSSYRFNLFVLISD